jgi:hypothetical protein
VIKETQTTGHDPGQLAEDASALMAATADVAGEKVSEATDCKLKPPGREGRVTPHSPQARIGLR